MGADEAAYWRELLATPKPTPPQRVRGAWQHRPPEAPPALSAVRQNLAVIQFAVDPQAAAAPAARGYAQASSRLAFHEQPGDVRHRAAPSVPRQRAARAHWLELAGYQMMTANLSIGEPRKPVGPTTRDFLNEIMRDRAGTGGGGRTSATPPVPTPVAASSAGGAPSKVGAVCCSVAPPRGASAPPGVVTPSAHRLAPRVEVVARVSHSTLCSGCGSSRASCTSTRGP